MKKNTNMNKGIGAKVFAVTIGTAMMFGSFALTFATETTQAAAETTSAAAEITQETIAPAKNGTTPAAAETDATTGTTPAAMTTTTTAIETTPAAVETPPAQPVLPPVTGFTDVSDKHWARENILFAAQKEIVKGYFNEAAGTYSFMPEKNVSYEEATTMLWRTLKAAGLLGKEYTADEKTALIAKYDEVMTSANIATWAKEYVADFLERGILTQDSIKVFVGEGNLGNPAPRSVVAVWTAKALDKNLAAAYFLPYSDATSILPEDRPYVDMLYRHGIMKGSLQADGSVSFLPNDGVKRSEFAAIAGRVYEGMNAGYKLEAETYNFPEAKSIYTAKEFLLVSNGKSAQKISNGSGAIQDYLGGATIFVVSGTTDKDLPQLHIDTQPATGKGEVTSVETVKDKDGSDVTILKISTDGYDVAYMAAGTVKNIKSVQKGDTVSFIADGINIVEIQ